ncbi:MAG: MBL fold metallo-hydrolase [Bdellovibrionota bacterium]|nr:MBL fold metallo-hydrolase [Bdellovibrionota bacterium]
MPNQKDFTQNADLFKLNLGEISIEGISMAGICTHISVPELKICFDVGYSHPKLSSHKFYFITHGHMDHAAGIPYLISNKALNKQKPPTFYMPKSMIEPMDSILKTWAKMEGHDYKWNFLELKDEGVWINPHYQVRSFKTFHRVESQGYLLNSFKEKLKPEYRHLKAPEIADLKASGVEIQEKIFTPLLAVTGDTKIEFLEESPELFAVKYLVVECTYATDVKSVESCREWGHIHFDELIKLLPKFKGEKVILKHFSRRHSYSEILKVLDEKCSPDLREKLLVFPW